MEQQIYDEIPQLITVAVTKLGYHTTINFDIERVGDGYTTSSVTVTEKPSSVSVFSSQSGRSMRVSGQVL